MRIFSYAPSFLFESIDVRAVSLRLIAFQLLHVASSPPPAKLLGTRARKASVNDVPTISAIHAAFKCH
jgi:hypothetical protein